MVVEEDETVVGKDEKVLFIVWTFGSWSAEPVLQMCRTFSDHFFRLITKKEPKRCLASYKALLQHFNSAMVIHNGISKADHFLLSGTASKLGNGMFF